MVTDDKSDTPENIKFPNVSQILTEVSLWKLGKSAYDYFLLCEDRQ